MIVRAVRPLEWIAPLDVAAALSDRDGALCLLSDGGPNGRFSFVACDPDRIVTRRMQPDASFDALEEQPEGFVVGLATYDAGARAATGDRGPSVGDWPDLTLACYPAMLVFDHADAVVSAVGLGQDDRAAADAAGRAVDWWARAVRPRSTSGPLAEGFDPERPDQAYIDAVADVVARIAAGELFQANIARAWRGDLRQGADPFDVFVRLAVGTAPYGAFWRIGERVLVSNSPELFLTFDPATGRIETRPIKGTRARSSDAAVDAAAAAELVASAKDRAENLMIVDLMRNDLSRVSRPGSVVVERLFALESFATVHHLVSTVTGTASAGVGPAEVLAAAFPPGSITGAPKHQAIRVIAGHEDPRGPWCGSLFLRDDAGQLTASVLIRTIGFQREAGVWQFRTLAGAGIVADSDPALELAETDAKIAAIRSALTG